MEAGNGGGDWRADLPPGARQRIAEKIFEKLLKWFPTDLTEGLIDLHRVAEKLEWRMYSLARNQGDYLRRISLRGLYFESPSPSPCAPVPQQPQLALPSQEDNHKLEVRHNGTEEDLLDTDPPRSHKKLCKEDRLSNLPDEMLHHIMSFLLAKELARTCVLSQRWRMLWTTTPCLDISIVQFCNDRVRFSMFVDHLLLSRAPASLDTFRLHSFAVDRACNWIDHAIKHNVRVLEFTECTWEPLFLDPQCIAFTSEFLTYLKLTNVALDTNIFDALNHACPSLETLQLICSFFEASEICPNSLKNLDIIDCSFSKDLMICTPNLISLCIAQCKSTSSFYNFSKITASVTLCDLSSAKNIELSSSVTEKFQFGKETLRRQMFDNLTSLSLGEWCLLDNFAPLVYFLLHSPQLKKLTLKLKVESDDGVEIDPVCLRERRSFSSDLLKKVIIFCHEGDARVAVLTTMLRANAKSLAEVEIRRYYKSCCQ